MSGWQESDEGDLDHDLTEEAGYGPWDPSPRPAWRVAYQLLSLIALVSIIGTVVVQILR